MWVLSSADVHIIEFRDCMGERRLFVHPSVLVAGFLFACSCSAGEPDPIVSRAIDVLEEYGRSDEFINGMHWPKVQASYWDRVAELPDSSMFIDWYPGPYMLMFDTTLSVAYQDSGAETMATYTSLSDLLQKRPTAMSARHRFVGFTRNVPDSLVLSLFRDLRNIGVPSVTGLYVKTRRYIEENAPDSNQIKAYEARVRNSKQPSRTARYAELQIQEIGNCPDLGDAVMRLPDLSMAERHTETIAALRKSLTHGPCDMRKLVNLYYLLYMPGTAFVGVDYDIDRVLEGEQQLLR